MKAPCGVRQETGVADALDSTMEVLKQPVIHVSVCVCTYKRPLLLNRLLKELNRQETGGLFTYSIVVVDNDEARSAERTVAESRGESTVAVKYFVEPRRSIALARNKVVEKAEGDFIALIDDDEFPISNWLLTLFRTCHEHHVDGVLGPVIRHFDEAPPKWLQRGRFFERKVNPTGKRVEWREARTGNVLLKQQVFAGGVPPFRPQFRVGEDQDFFKRKIDEGCTFVWSAEAAVYETVPPARWKRTYLVRRALLGGAMDPRLSTYGIRDISKSLLAVPLYIFILPFTLLLGQHRFMELLVSLCYHLGGLLALVGIHLVREEYVTE